jgi:hypothetical protein
MPEEKKEIAVINTGNVHLTVEKLNEVMGETSLQVLTSLTLPMDIVNAMGDADYKLRSLLEDKGTINMVDFLVHRVEIAPENSEADMLEGDRVVIIDDQGETFACVAEGAKKGLAKIFAVYGLPPYNPPIVIMPREVDTRKGRRTMNLKVIDDGGRSQLTETPVEEYPGH